MTTRRVPKADGLRRNASGVVMAGSFTAKLINSCGPIIGNPGDVVEAWVEFQNIGTETWNEYTRLGTYDKQDRISLVYHDSWINAARPVACKNFVRPGEIFRFSFNIIIPANGRSIIEIFRLVQENITWFDKTPDNAFNLEIKIRSTVNGTRILYFSCHETLEHSELSILSKLGLNIFPVGFYSLPEPVNPTKEGIDFNIDKELQNKFIYYFGKNFKPGAPNKLNQDFINEFDIIICSHWTENIELNKQYFRNKDIIWRTIGLSNSTPENKIIKYKSELPLKIVRMTPGEPMSAGKDAIIRTHIDPDYFNGWVGNEEYVLTVQKWTRLGEIGRLANEYQEVTKNFPRKLCGRDNRGFDCIIDNPTSAELLDMRRKARVYFSLATKNAVHTYTFFEAMMTGMPVVSVGPKLAQTSWFENPKWIEHGINGFVSDNIDELKYYIDLLLKDYELAKKLGSAARQSVINEFSPTTIMEAWRKFFEKEYNIFATGNWYK